MTDFSLAFTDKEITPWSGLALLKRLGGRLGFFEHFSNIGLPEPGSNRGYKPEQLITQLMMSVWCGANRYEHCEVNPFAPSPSTSPIKIRKFCNIIQFS